MASQRRAYKFNFGRKVLLSATSVAAITGLLVFGVLNAPLLRAQSPGNADSKMAAHGKMEFDVASVKRDTVALSGSTQHSNIGLDPTLVETPTQTGGLLSATNFPLIQYLIFAYGLAPHEVQSVQAQLPKWANTTRYDIQARTSGNPTKSQFQFMTQALLADRFKLIVHYETRQLPVFALVLDRPGKLGPHFRPHPDDSSCSTAPALASARSVLGFATTADGFPEVCGGLSAGPPSDAPGHLLAGARNVTMEVITSTLSFPRLTGIDRPILDKTGLTGKFDFIIEFSPEVPPGSKFQPDANGPTFIEALKEQLGLKLVPQTGPVEVLIVDHVEEPSEN